eukprot:TRINITY_DN2554_c0_g1_i1.p1 TRINITY_DN2554_c0_g1~~TRINITY_DN2554_c0_g1_i1.p1  ORF type:complete len:218 (+),score=16.61 TRINITY_DN2554_c0_g1_i1:469-1122(+)
MQRKRCPDLIFWILPITTTRKYRLRKLNSIALHITTQDYYPFPFCQHSQACNCMIPKKKKWQAGPTADSGLGVIWLGKAAENVTEGKLKAGVHRVVFPKKKHRGIPRMSIWAELCTFDQAFPERWQPASETEQSKKFSFGSADWKTVPDKILVSNMRGKPYIVRVEKGNLLKALRTVEELHGLPLSKIMKVPIYNDEGEVTAVERGSFKINQKLEIK